MELAWKLSIEACSDIALCLQMATNAQMFYIYFDYKLDYLLQSLQQT